MRMVSAVLLAAAALSLPALAQQQRSEDRNEAVVRRFVERSNQQDLEGMLSLFADDAKNFGQPVGREGFRRVLADIREAFPDWHIDIMEMVAQGDSVVMWCKVSGTHRGTGKLPINGGMLVGVPPTGKHFETDHIHWWKIRDGRIVDHYAARDDISMMRQLGLIPPVSSPSPSPK
jgi:steroid delta-isomerase-like uncharacterized protein